MYIFEYHEEVHFPKIKLSSSLDSLPTKSELFSPFCLNIDDHGFQVIQIKNPASQNVRIYIRSIKKGAGPRSGKRKPSP